MAQTVLTLAGMEALQQTLRSSPERAKALAADAVAKTAFAVAQRARSLVPVGDTGTLKSLIASSSNGLTGRVGLSDTARGFYWRFVEYGTIHMPARPFFRPAAEGEADAFIQRMRDACTRLERDFGTGRLL